MGTTLVIVELLIIGFQVLAWIVLLLIPFTNLKGDNLVKTLKELEGWVPVIVVLVLALAYTLGIVFDRFLGWITLHIQDVSSNPDIRKKHRFIGFCISLVKVVLIKCLPRKIFQYLISKCQTIYDINYDIREKHRYILLAHAEANKQLENVTRQISLLRATFFNTFLIFLIVSFKYDFLKALWLLPVSIVALLTWKYNSFKIYPDAVKEFYKLIKKREYDKRSEK
jgi:hypothetical protein